MVESILEQIYGQQAHYENFTYTLYNEKETILQLKFPSNWHHIDVMETTVGGIRVKKFYYDLRSRITGEWVDQKTLQEQEDITLTVSDRSKTVEGAFEHRLYKGYGGDGNTLMMLDIPGGQTEPFESNGVRMKKENGQIHFKVEDLHRLNVIQPLTESESFSMYFNVDDLTAKGILK